MAWLRICAVEDCPPGEAREFVACDRVVALFHVDQHFYALDGICPHQGGPLGKGFLNGCIVTCPWHGFQFDVTTGQHQASQSLRHPTIPVKIADDAVYVELES
jgi:nitrite reductase (NADH) small subunit